MKTPYLRSKISFNFFGVPWALTPACAICVFVLLFVNFAPPASGANFEFRGKIEAHDSVSNLLAHYVNEFAPEELFLSMDEQPDDSGSIRDLYMNLTGVLIDGFRLDKLVFRRKTC